MVNSSLSFFFSSASTSRRLVIIIFILLLNPSPFIYGVPTEHIDNHNIKLSRHKRHVNLNNDDILVNGNVFLPEQEILLEGLIGCKYDLDLCNPYEACFDDALFGQCWDGKGPLHKAFALENSLDGLTNNKLTALEYTIEFLNRYHLDWRDYMTQCILSHVLSDHHHQLNRYHLKSFYSDCLNKDKLLDNLAAIQEESTIINRRQNNNKFPYYDSHPPLIKAKSLFFDLDRPFDVSSFMPFNELSRLSSLKQPVGDKQIQRDGQNLITVQKSMVEESEMKPTKISLKINEGHPSLVETLQINNNKQVLPLPNEQTMASTHLTNKTKTMIGSDTKRYYTVETTHGYIIINRDFKDEIEGARLLTLVAQINSWPVTIFTELNADRHTLTFRVVDNAYRINASNVASAVLNNKQLIDNQLGIKIIESGIGNPNRGAQLSVERQNGSRLAIITMVTCTLAIFIMGSFAIFYVIRRNDQIRNKLAEITQIKSLSTHDYQDSHRQHIQTQPSKHKSVTTQQIVLPPTSSLVKHDSESSSSRSSTSSWTEEPVTSVDMDIMTGHLILSYMEDHVRDRHRLESEWQSLCMDQANEERASCSIALSETNHKKNRYIDCIPYDHTRVRLENNDDGDYINASVVYDSNPKCKYIATQGPMPNTTNAFWQMVWQQGSCVIVALTRPIENGITMCHHYWPVEGSARFNDFEVNLVSEHIWSEDYVVRSFYLKNIQTMETRTVTQFHFLTWDELCNPPSAKSVLDFRRKVNKCFRGRSSPIIIHCNDGIGRTGTYILLDIVLNRIYKGAREINIAATLEHIRDQRAGMVKTKNQFQFVFVAVAEEVTHLLKALSQ